MKTVLLLDADIIAYKFAAAAQELIKFDEDSVGHLIVSPLDQVTAEVDSYIDWLVETLDANDFLVCLSCSSKDNFRLTVLPSYKENRKGLERPVLLGQVRDYLASRYPTYQRPNLEADDVMGILSTSKSIIKGKKIIVSEDKDMQQIPGWLFNPRKDDKPRYISREEADHYHMMQTLTGDPVDGYKGCPGVGPKKAEKILLDDGNPENQFFYWKNVVAAYESKGLTEEDALVQARVSRICRVEDYDFKGKKVILWTPNVSV